MCSKNFVWAKMKGFSAWPAKICPIPPENIGKPKKPLTCVYFFGTYNFAWLSSDQITDYSEGKERFSTKNKTPTFKKAIAEIEVVISEQEAIHASDQLNDVLTLKNVPIGDILITLNDFKPLLQSIFNQRRFKLDRFNVGNGYDYLTVLWQVVSPEQQQAMYSSILSAFIDDEEKYIGNRTYENLFWTILLPEWVIAICEKKFSRTKEQTIQKIKKDDEDSNNRGFSFD